MTLSVFWLQAGGCGGDTWSFLNAESPDVIEFFEDHDIDLLWHPSLSTLHPGELSRLLTRLANGDQPLDVLCVEGTILNGPDGSGMFDELCDRPKKEIVEDLARQARFVLAVGTCASFGGISGGGFSEGTGLQYEKWTPGGLLGASFKTHAGRPVINLPGCPCHCDVIIGMLSAIALETPLDLIDYNTPREWYGIMVHQGCTRNEYHEYRVEEKVFGEKGCMFFHMGCHGPLVTGPCNKKLWNRRSSKTRVGVPCFGCTRPDFPQHYPFFETQNIEGLPIELPDGVSRAHYMAYKGMAAAAAPTRLKKRKTGI